MTERARVRFAFLIFSVAVLGACTLGPRYVRPAAPAPARWQDAEPSPDAVANLSWWHLLNDEELRGLVKIALAENRDALLAAAAIEEFRARVGISQADLYPSINLTGEAGRVRPGLDGTRDSASFAARGGLSWEIDVWGRIRRSNEAARAELLAREENRRAVVLTLVGDVASGYFLLLGADRELDISRRTLASRNETLRLSRSRFSSGLTSELDVRQFQAQAASAVQSVARLEREQRQKEDALSVLLGRSPYRLPRGHALEAQTVPPDVPPGLPSALLERRPDVLAAERALAAATARIGVAQAARLPSFSLTGLLGVQSAELSSLLDSPSRLYQLLGTVAAPIFNAGRLKNQVRVAQAQAVAARLSWEKTVLVALKEVEDGLIAQSTWRREVAAASEQTEALRAAARLASVRYENGVSSYLEVLDADRSLFAAELALSQTESQRLVASVRLFQALGGGWPVSP
ncbi:MAG: efflux transporter outer membrane subunit [Thermoanaerobaculia bacterium]